MQSLIHSNYLCEEVMRKQIITLSLILFISLNMFIFFIGFNNKNDVSRLQRETFHTKEKYSLENSKNIMLNQISIILADLKFVGNNIVDMERLDVDALYVNELWKDFIESKVFYDQIRYIDQSGLEKIRVNSGEKSVYSVPEELLQNKANRYYFQDTIDLRPEDYYISRLDLNVENENIEVPYKPMIRFSKPIYDNEKLLGISVINYKGQYLLDSLKMNIQNSNATDVYLLNEEGYWLLSSNENYIEWGFMFSEYEDSNFEDIEPMVWKDIKTNKQGYTETDNGIYTYTEVLPESSQQEGLSNIDAENIILGEGNWYIVTYLANDDPSFIEIFTLTSYFTYLFTDRLEITIGILLIVVLLTLAFAWYLKTKIQVDKASKYDEMTLAFNRKYGLEKATELYRSAMRNNKKWGIIFCDINGLKFVNDKYGHDFGDDLIKSFAQTIQEEIRWEQNCFINEIFKKNFSWSKRKTDQREGDLFIRMGGDEFLLLFKDIDDENLKEIWERIVLDYKTKFIKDVQVSASGGLVVITPKMNMALEEAIKLADKAMYEEKSQHYLARN